MFGRQSFKVGDRHRFWGGLNVEAVGGGHGLVDMLFARAEKAGVEIRYGTAARRLLVDARGAVRGVGVRAAGGGLEEIAGRAVVLACGGFEANPEWRTRYLGPDWELARVRGTRHNTGDGIRMALDIGAQPYGHWSSCHAVAWDANAPEFGDRKVLDLFQKHSYPLGLIVNVRGERFVDEGADYRNMTYAQVRAGDPPAAAAPGVPALRPEDGADPPRGVPHPRDHQGRGADHRGAGEEARDRPRRARPHGRRLQRRRPARRVQPGGARRQAHGRDHAAQVELGAAAGHAAVRGLRGDVRDHLHLRRTPDHPRGGGARPGGPADPRALRRRRAGGGPLLPQLSRRLRAHGGRPSSASSPASTPPASPAAEVL